MSTIDQLLAKARGEEPIPTEKIVYSKQEKASAGSILENLLGIRKQSPSLPTVQPLTSASEEDSDV